MSCNGERRKINLGYGSNNEHYFHKEGKWHYYSFYGIGGHYKELPLHVRVYRRKCDKPSIEWVVARLKDLEMMAKEAWKPKPGDVIKFEEIKREGKWWKVWRRG